MSHRTTKDSLVDIAYVARSLMLAAEDAKDTAHLNLLVGERRKLFEQDAHRKIRQLIDLLDSLPTQEPQ